MKKALQILTFTLLFFFVALPVSAKEPPKTITLPKSEVINRDYFAGSERVITSGTVNGDAYIAGGESAFDGTVNGDLITVGGMQTISGVVDGDLRIAGGNIYFSGAKINGNVTVFGGSINVDQSTDISGSVVAVGGTLQFMGPIGKNLTVAGGEVTVGNTVGGDIWSPGLGSLRLTKGALVKGQLTYTSENEAVLSEGADVDGTTTRRAPPVKSNDVKEAGGKGAAGLAGLFVFIWLGDIVMSVILGLLLVFFLPNFVIRVSEKAINNIGTSFLIGLVVTIVTPIALLLFMLTLVGIPLSLALFAIFFLVLWFAKVIGSIALGRRILKTKKTESSYKAMFLGVVLYFVAGIIPLLGGLLQAFITITGLGSLAINKKEYYNELRAKKIL